MMMTMFNQETNQNNFLSNNTKDNMNEPIISLDKIMAEMEKQKIVREVPLNNYVAKIIDVKYNHYYEYFQVIYDIAEGKYKNFILIILDFHQMVNLFQTSSL